MNLEDFRLVAETRSLLRSGRAKALRQASSVSLEEIAGAAGVSHTAVWRWEQGLSSPRPAAALRYREALRALCFEEVEM